MHLFIVMLGTMWGHIVLFLQVAADQAGAVVVSHPSATAFGTEVTLAGIAVKVIEWAKDKKWIPFVNRNAATINKVTAAVVALLSAVGVSHVWDSSTRSLTIGNIPTMASAGIIAWTWAKQWIMQEWLYHTGVANPSNTPVQQAKAAVAEAQKQGNVAIVAVNPTTIEPMHVVQVESGPGTPKG